MTNGIIRIFEFDVFIKILSGLGFLFVFLTTILKIDLGSLSTDFQKGMLAGALLLFAVFVLLNAIDRIFSIRRSEEE